MLRLIGTALELEAVEAVAIDRILAEGHDLLGRLFAALAGLLVFEAEEDVAGEGYLAAVAAADHVAQRAVRLLGDDVPERDLDARDRGQAEVALEVCLHVEALQDILDVEGVLALQLAGHLADALLDAVVAARLADAGDALIGVDFDERARGGAARSLRPENRRLEGHVDTGGFDAFNLHGDASL